MNSNNPTILVLGAGGYGGSHIVRVLLESGNYNVIAVDRYHDKSDIRQWQASHDNCRVVTCDILDIFALHAYLKLEQPNLTINAAGRVPGATFEENQSIDFKTQNGRLTKNAIDVSHWLDCEHFIQLSTCAVREMTQQDTEKNSYAASKFESEFFTQHSGLNYTIIRKPNIWGDNMAFVKSCSGPKNFHMLVKLAKANLKNPMTILTKFNREWLHVADAAEAVVAYIPHQLSAGKIEANYEIGTGREISAIDIAETAGNFLQPGSLIIKDGQETHYQTDPSEFMAKTGWHPRHSIHNLDQNGNWVINKNGLYMIVSDHFEAEAIRRQNKMNFAYENDSRYNL